MVTQTTLTSQGLKDLEERLEHLKSVTRKEIAEKIKPWLSRFDGISVREKTAVTMVESIVDKEVVQVLDPCLLYTSPSPRD